MKKRKLIKSFFPISEIVIKNQLVSDGIYFDLDKEGYIYCIQEMEYKIYKYTITGELVKTFSKRNPYYLPPPSKPFKEFYIRSALEDWIKRWTHVIGINISGNLLIVNLFNFKPFEHYILDIYDLNGNFINGGLATDYRFLCTDTNGNLYFLGEEERSSTITYSILKFSINRSKLGNLKTK